MSVATLNDWLLFGHLVAAMVWLGGGVVLTAMALATLPGRDAQAVVRFVARLRVLDRSSWHRAP